MEWGCLRRVVPAAAVTTHAKPHAQQQLARDLEVKRAAMGQRCRPQSFGEVQRDRVIFWYPYSSTSMEWGGLRRLVPAAAVTTHAKPHGQQQLARDLEVEHAAYLQNDM